MSFETSPSSANDPYGPAMPNPGPTFPSVVADAASESSVPTSDAADRRVDGDDRRADSPEPDVEEDEGRDGANGPLVDG